jgi:hypothetical protein
MHAQHLEKRTAVRLAALTGRAVATVEVRSDRAPVPKLQTGHTPAKRHDLNAELVTKHARIGEERLIPLKRVIVGTAHTHLPNMYEDFT